MCKEVIGKQLKDWTSEKRRCRNEVIEGLACQIRHKLSLAFTVACYDHTRVLPTESSFHGPAQGHFLMIAQETEIFHFLLFCLWQASFFIAASKISHSEECTQQMP